MRNCSPACVFATGVAMALALALAQASSSPCLAPAMHSTAPSPSFDFLVCRFCGTPRFRLMASNVTIDKALCQEGAKGEKIDPDKAADFIAGAIIDYGRVQGQYWADVGAATRSLAHLLRYMPIRDSMKLLQPDDFFLDYILENVRLALLVRMSGPIFARNTSLVSDSEFLDYVLPYSFLDEKRDVAFRWRRRFFHLFFANFNLVLKLQVAPNR